MQAGFRPLGDFVTYRESEMRVRSERFLDDVRRRRSVRQFSTSPVPREVIENCIRAAGTAPSGANRQPWHFVVVSDSRIKSAIRKAAEEEERAFYHERAPADWLEALAPLGTDDKKPFLEEAPYLIVVFAEAYGETTDGERVKNYYVSESVGIATGILITALHNAGLATLTHTPSPMKFLNQILRRPARERPFVLMPVGLPADGAVVPDIQRKDLSEISSWV
ncbi:MAG: nitroreductase family protein [Rhodothermia bacterium]|nr:nitroreductase family protein [Rhodothermia bacterium]